VKQKIDHIQRDSKRIICEGEPNEHAYDFLYYVMHWIDTIPIPVEIQLYLDKFYTIQNRTSWKQDQFIN